MSKNKVDITVLSEPTGEGVHDYYEVIGGELKKYHEVIERQKDDSIEATTRARELYRRSPDRQARREWLT